MISIYIKQCGNPGRDAQIFRAYSGSIEKPKPTGVSCSCTGNVEHGARGCAVKVFTKFFEPLAEREEIETRIDLKSVALGLWIATLHPKKPDLAAKGGQS